MADGVDSIMHEFGAGKSAIREVFEQTCALRERGVTGLCDLSLGNPAVPPPSELGQAIRDALADLDPLELHGYGPNNGWPATRQAIADDLNERFEAGCRADDLILTAGAAGAITSTIGALTTAGEDVIVLVPYFPEYRMYIQAWHCKCVEVPTTPGTFQLDVDAIARAITPSTRMVIVNSPNNPTGAVYDEASLAELAALLRRESARLGQTIYLMSDEPYREIVYDGARTTWVPDLYENTIVCYSYSKSLSVAGERVGYVYVPASVRNHDIVYDALLGAQRAVGSFAPTIMQHALVRCCGLTSDLAQYARKRDVIYGGLTELGYDVVRPDGAFYLWVRALEPDDEAFAARAAAEQRLFLVNSTDFGCPGYERLSYAVSDDDIAAALRAFEGVWESYGGYRW